MHHICSVPPSIPITTVSNRNLTIPVEMLQEWIDKYTNFDINKVIQAIQEKNISFSIDGSFFPQNSKYIAAHIIITKGKKKLGIANFICTISIPYCHAYVAELCGTLAIFKIIQLYLLSSLITLISPVPVEVNSDCALVLSFIPSSQKIINNSISLYQVKQEILYLKQIFNLTIKPNKIQAYQNDKRSWNCLSFQEKINTICNKRAKYLILKDTRE